MKSNDPVRETEVFCDVIVVLALLFSGCATAFTLHSLLSASPGGAFRFDVVGEVKTMAFVLNGVLPLGVAALVTSTGIKVRRKSLRPLALCLALAGLVGIIGCALAMYLGIVAGHPEPGFLPRIWWWFGASTR